MEKAWLEIEKKWEKEFKEKFPKDAKRLDECLLQEVPEAFEEDLEKLTEEFAKRFMEEFVIKRNPYIDDGDLKEMKDYKNIQINFKVLQSHLMQIYFTLALKPNRVLEIGKGNGFVSSILNRYCNLTTLDINQDNNPDLIIDITNLKQLDTINDDFFDLILICEVLEHIPYKKIDGILRVLKKKTKKYLVLSVPNQSAYFNLTLFYYGLSRLGINALKKIVQMFSIKIGSVISKLHYRFRNKYKEFTLHYNTDKSVKHYWELGIDKYDVKSFKTLLNKYFTIMKDGRLREQPWHHFFIMHRVEGDTD